MDQIVKRPRRAGPEGVEAALGLDRRGRSATRGRWIVRIGLLALLIAAAAAGWSYLARPAPPPSYASVAAARGDLTIEVTATGTLQPLTQVEVSSELSGIVRAVNVRENERVTRGQIIAELDTARLAAQVERAEASVKAAAARVGEARVTLNETEQALARATSLASRGMVAEQALDTATAARDRALSAFETAEANLAIAEAELKLQRTDLDKSAIVAPIDGMILSRAVDPGQTVAASMSAPVLFVIAENLERMELKAAIDEADIGSIAIGQNARFTVDAFPGRRFDAAISDIAYAAATTEGVVTYEARLVVDNEDLLLRPGMTATVNVVTRQADDVITVPVAAFRFSPPPPDQSGGQSFSLQSLFMPRMGGGRGGGRFAGRGGDAGRALWVLTDTGEPERRTVEVGASDGEQTEILSGLEEGERVILGMREGSGRAGGRPGGGGRAGGPGR